MCELAKKRIFLNRIVPLAVLLAVPPVEVLLAVLLQAVHHQAVLPVAVLPQAVIAVHQAIRMTMKDELKNM